MTDGVDKQLGSTELARRLEVATAAAGVGIFSRDTLTEQAHWNDQMYQICGWPAELGPPSHEQWIDRIIHPSDRATMRTARAELMASKSGSVQHEFRILLPDGTTRWLVNRVRREEWNGRMMIFGATLDITERRVAAEVRREAQAAQRQSEAKSDLLARMSHELRTPLNAILGFTQLLEIEAAQQPMAPSGDSANQTSRDQMLRHIRLAAERLLELVDDVLDISRIQTTAAPAMALQAIELTPLLHDIVGSIARRKPAKAVSLRMHERQLSVRADPARLRQVLTRVLTHQLSLLGARASIEIGTQIDGDEARISISDRSPGPSPASQFDLFDSLAKEATPGRSSRDRAQDLGLFSALLAGMDGRMTPASGNDDASSIAIWLPLAMPATVGETPALQAEATAQARVLYIEDNPVNVILVEQLVAQRGGIDFCSESTGLAGVARAAAILPDLVLIDIHLPDIDGFEVLRRLRANPATSRIHCVALSANVMPEDIARAKSSGFDDYWTKPIRFSSFLAGLDRLLPATKAS